MSWSEVFLLVLKNQANYRYIMPSYETLDRIILGEMYIRYLINDSGCPGVLKWCSESGFCGYYDFLLKDDCALLKLLMFSAEKSWYPTLALVDALANRVPVSGNYSLWALI